jgi:hypothetical protein
METISSLESRPELVEYVPAWQGLHEPAATLPESRVLAYQRTHTVLGPLATKPRHPSPAGHTQDWNCQPDPVPYVPAWHGVQEAEEAAPVKCICCQAKTTQL